MIADSRRGISFIVPVLNGEKYIRRCIEHIIEEMGSEDELIIVDNGSTDKTLSITKEYEQARLFEHPDVTISTLRNRGACEASNDILAFIDSDCLVCQGWRQSTLNRFKGQEVQAAGSFYDLPTSPTWVEVASTSARRKEVKPTHLLLGGNFVIRHATFDEIGGFNEKLVTDEDSELCLRLRQKGHVVMDDPAIRVIHLGNAKTLLQHYRKTKWHSTSALQTMFAQRIDKPMVMTLAFMLSVLWFFVAIPLAVMELVCPLFIILPLISVPAITAVFRVFQWGNYLRVHQLFVIYLVYYAARSVVIIEIISGLTTNAKYKTDSSRGK